MSSNQRAGRLALAAMVITATGLVAAPSSATLNATPSENAQQTGAAPAEKKAAKKARGKLRCGMTVRLEGKNKAHPHGVMARTKVKCNFVSPRIMVRAGLFRKPGSNNRHTNIARNVTYKRSVTFIPCGKKVRKWKARGIGRISPPKNHLGKPKVTVKKTKWSEGRC